MTEVNNTRKKLEKYGMSDVLCLYDAAQFCIMFDADLTVLARDMCVALRIGGRVDFMAAYWL